VHTLSRFLALRAIFQATATHPRPHIASAAGPLSKHLGPLIDDHFGFRLASLLRVPVVLFLLREQPQPSPANFLSPTGNPNRGYVFSGLKSCVTYTVYPGIDWQDRIARTPGDWNSTLLHAHTLPRCDLRKAVARRKRHRRTKENLHRSGPGKLSASWFLHMVLLMGVTERIRQ